MAAGVVLAAAMGGFSTPQSRGPRGTIARAFTATARAGTARVMVSIDAGGRVSSRGPNVATTIVGIVGFAPARGTLVLEAPEAGFGGPLAAAVTTTSVLAGGILYTRQGDLAGSSDSVRGRHWFKRTVTNDDEKGLFGVATVAGRSAALPKDLLGPSPSLRRVGREPVAGTVTTHYRVLVAAGAGHPAVLLELWIDARERVRRLRETVTGSVTETIEYSDFGVRVPNDVPPPGDVLDRDQFGRRTTPTIPEDA